MCHICRKIEALGSVDSQVTKPMFAILSKLHQSAEPRMGDMWLWRLEQTEKLQTLLRRLYKFVPISALKAILDDVDKDIIHIKKSMPDHPPLRRIPKMDHLRSTIGPSESASARFYMENELQAEQVEKAKNQPDSIRRPSTEVAVLDRGPTPELKGSDIDPSSPRIRESIRMVDEWFDKCDNSARPHTETDSGDDSIVSDAIGKIRERPKVEAEAIWKNLTTKRSENLDKAVRRLGDEKRRKDEEYSMAGGRSLGSSAKVSLESASKASSRTERSSLYSRSISKKGPGLFFEPSDASTMSSRPSTLNAGSIMRKAQSSLHKNAPGQRNTDKVLSERESDRFSSSSVTSPRVPVAIGRDLSPVREPKVRAPELVRETRQLSREQEVQGKPSERSANDRTEKHSSSRSTRHEREKSLQSINAERQDRTKDQDVSDAIRSSRQRRAERASTSVPSNDRYRHDERDKHWQTRNT